MREHITMSMKEIDQLRIIEGVISGDLTGKEAGVQLGLSARQVWRKVKRVRAQGPSGIVHGLRGRALDAVASVGDRPTFGGTKPILEVHIFDFDEDIYGEYIHVDFIARLRGQEKYDRVEDLVAQMHLDADNARSIQSQASTLVWGPPETGTAMGR